MAQTPVWIQIETRPSLLEIEDRARAYSAKLPNISAFSLGSGWYVIAMGPFSEEIADAQRRDLQSRLAIPSDSFVTSGSSYGAQIWPSSLQSGSGVETATLAPQDGTGRTQRRIITEPLKDSNTQTDLEDETLEQARLTESQLSMPEKKNLQTALKSEGYYTSVIDGLFGQGTRSSMQAWQEDNGFDATGVLTSQQRQELLAQYNAVLEDLGLRLMTDLEAGISLKMPMGLVEFERYAPPLAHFKAKDDSAAAIYLISQAGDSKALRAIYKALGSTEIIPENGPRRLYDDRFSIRGEDRAIISFAQAELVEGSIKGFVLVWPAQQKSQQKRLLREMRQSFGVLSGALDPDLGRAYGAMPDQVYGLNTKKPIFVRSGIYVSGRQPCPKTGYTLLINSVVKSRRPMAYRLNKWWRVLNTVCVRSTLIPTFGSPPPVLYVDSSLKTRQSLTLGNTLMRVWLPCAIYALRGTKPSVVPGMRLSLSPCRSRKCKNATVRGLFSPRI